LFNPASFNLGDVSPPVWWLAFAIVAAILLIPLTLTEIPPLLDYPNHLARMEILAHGAGDPALSRMYQAEWRILPNIAIDVAMPALMRFMPLALAGKIFLAAALLLPLAGVAALHRVLFQVRSLWPLAAGLVVYNRLFFAGFMNFLIGSGLALLAAALWETQMGRETRKGAGAAGRIATACVIAIVIFFCHLIALAFYGLVLAGLELARADEHGRLTFRRLDVRRLGLLAIPFVIPAILYFNAPISDAGDAGGHGVVDMLRQYYWRMASEPVGLKPYGLVGSVLSYNRWLDAACLVLVLALLALALFRHCLTVARAPIGVMTFLLVAYPFTTFAMLGTYWIDQRLPILAGFLLFAGTSPGLQGPNLPARRAMSPVAAVLPVALLAVALLARTAEIGLVWSTRDAQLADFREVIAPVGPGDRVLVVQPDDDSHRRSLASLPDTVDSMLYNDSTMHLAALLVIERHAFWPLLFSAPSKQPVKVLPPYSAVASTEGVPPWVGALAGPRPADLASAPYLAHWRDNFDWVLLLRPGRVPGGYDLLPDLLEPVTAGRVAVLYRIRKTPAR
jgi:hypothetical protein